MRLKKTLAMLLLAAMALTLLTGCDLDWLEELLESGSSSSTSSSSSMDAGPGGSGSDDSDRDDDDSNDGEEEDSKVDPEAPETWVTGATMTIPDGVTITSDMVREAMEGGKEVSSIELSLDANVESDAFDGLRDITIRVSSVAGKTLENASILGGATGVTLDLSQCVGLTIGGTAFAGNRDLKEVIFPSGVVIQDMLSDALNQNMLSDALNQTGAFFGCTGLEEVTFSGSANVGWYAFMDCTGLEEVTFSGPANVGWFAFARCTSLSDVVSMDKITQLGAGAFNMTAITTADLTGLTGPTLSTSITIEGDIGAAFMNCTQLTTVILPETIETINFSSFAQCTNLKNINLESVKTVEGKAFEKCNALRIADLKSAMGIGENAFVNSGIKYLRLGESLESLGLYSFSNTTDLTIYYDAGAEAWANQWGELLAKAGLDGADVKPDSAWDGDIATAQSAAGQLLGRFGF